MLAERANRERISEKLNVAEKKIGKSVGRVQKTK